MHSFTFERDFISCAVCNEGPGESDGHVGARNPTGPDAMHNDSAVVFARTVITSPAPGNRA